MKRSKKIIGVAVCAALAILVLGCPPPSPPAATTGSLEISLSDSINARTLTPPIDMNAASYTITGTGPNSASFTASSAGAAVTQANLSLGDWTVDVQALNSDGTVIGFGSATATVVYGTTTEVFVTVLPSSGTGSLSLTISWPSAQVQSSSITATLTPAQGSAQNLTFSISGSTATCTKTDIANGYYTLAFTINDSGHAAAGAVEVVRIVTGQITSGTYTFANVNRGKITVSIDVQPQNPLAVSLSGANMVMSAGSAQSLSAAVSNYSGNVSYVWYVNGSSKAIGGSYSFGTGLGAGYYRVDVTAFTADGTRAGSASANIQIMDLNVSGVVTTIAGSTTSGHGNGSGSAASFHYPCGITSDGTNLYVADDLNNEIRKIVIATGAVTTLAGSTASGHTDATGSAASFQSPKGITTDGIQLYVADSANNEIRKIVIATGAVTTVAGSTTSGHADGTGTAASFSAPMGIATDGTNLYVADTNDNEIRKIVISTGVVTTLAGSTTQGHADGTGTAASFSNPMGIATDGTNLYVADNSSNEIRAIVISTGVVSTLAGSTVMGNTDATGSAARFRWPWGVTTDGANLYIADSGNNEIREIVIATGAVTTLAGSSTSGHDDGTGSNASFNGAGGISTDGTYLYVVDSGNNEIRMIR